MAAPVRPDLALFVEHAGWLARIARLTRLELLAWLRQRLTARAVDRLRERLPLDHQVQRDAERAVIDVLRRRIQRRAPSFRAGDLPGRLVDWSRTYLSTLGQPPSRFWMQEPSAVPDAAVLGALATMASTWIQLLEDESSLDRRRRCDDLGKAIEGLPASLRRASIYHQGIERRLRRAAPEAATAIQTHIDFWSGVFGRDDARHLAGVAEDLDRADLESGNVDTLLELTSALSIARAALAAPPPDQPPTGPWGFQPGDLLSGRDRSYADFVLVSGDLVARISKGVPRSPGGTPAMADTLNDVLSMMGYKAIGNQPDIAITFWRSSAPHRYLVALGDAKRNASGSGEDYLRHSVEVAAVYAISYGSLAGLTIHGGAGSGFHGGISPAVTLFCRQGARKVAGENGDDLPAIVRRFRDDQSKLPPFVAFDMERHFAKVGLEWSSPALSAWFGRLARQAWRELSAG